MTTLKRRHTFRRWAPDLGENRELPESQRLYLELAVGLTDAQVSGLFDAIQQQPPVTGLEDLQERVKSADTLEAKVALIKDAEARGLDAFRAHVALCLSPFVRLVGGPHSINERHVETLADFIGVMVDSRDAGRMFLGELLAAIKSFNSLEGPDELFSLRRFGGLASTGSPSVVKEDSPAGAP